MHRFFNEYNHGQLSNLMIIPALQAHRLGQERRPRAGEFAHFSGFACGMFVICLPTRVCFYFYEP
jgi:hypothetical protein